MQHEVVGIKDRFIEWQFPVPTIEMDVLHENAIEPALH